MKILLVTHGNLACGYKDTIEMIYGLDERMYYLPAYKNDVELDKEIISFLENNKNEKRIIFTDVLGGSVNSLCLKLMQEYSFYLVTNINLPFILEFLSSSKHQEDLEEVIIEVVRNNNIMPVFCNELILGGDKND